jgi:hypothetical protein
MLLWNETIVESAYGQQYDDDGEPLSLVRIEEDTDDDYGDTILFRNWKQDVVLWRRIRFFHNIHSIHGHSCRNRLQ